MEISLARTASLSDGAGGDRPSEHSLVGAGIMRHGSWIYHEEQLGSNHHFRRIYKEVDVWDKGLSILRWLGGAEKPRTGYGGQT